MAKKMNRIAIAYNFDGTLAPGNMQEHNFLPALGIKPKTFWANAKKKAKEHDMDEILAYMQLTIDEAKTKNLPIRKSDFISYGKKIDFFEGVETYFERINAYARSKGLLIEHYVISSGLREFVKGTKISKYFENIFASGFEYDASGVAIWPALAVNYTSKTQYLFRINKGINNSYDNQEINKFMPEDERHIPFKQMIYIGDSETDVPAMKMIKYQGGKAEPDYRNSDMFQVSLTLRTEITDKAFHVFVSQYQNSEKEPKLGVEQIITLCKIRNGIFQNLKSEIVSQLEKSGLIEKISGHTNRYTLSQEYQALVNDGLKIGKRYLVKELELILMALQGNALKMGELEKNLEESLNRNQIKYLTGKLFEDKVLHKDGKGSGTVYTIHPSYSLLRGDNLLQKIIDYLRNKYDHVNSPKTN